MPRLEFVIPGKPVPKARPRVTRNRTFTPQRTKDFEEHVGICAMIAHNRTRQPWDVNVEYGIECRFYFAGKPRVDGDNLLKSIQDGLEGVLYVNDTQVTQGHYFVYKGAQEDKTEVGIWVESL